MTPIDGYLVVYKCTDDGEVEACFFEYDHQVALNYIATAQPPEGFEHRPGYYFIEKAISYV